MKTLLAIASERGHLATAPRSVVICHHCTGMNWTTEDLILVKIDDEMRARIDPSDLEDLDRPAEHLRHLKRARGEHAADPRAATDRGRG